MADISDAENAVLAAVLAAVCPNGTGQPSITGARVETGRGWPQEVALNGILARGASAITVYPKPGHDRAAPLPLGSLWYQSVAPVVTLTASASGDTATFDGDPAAGQIAAVIIRQVGFAYAVQDADTLDDVAAALAAAVNSDGRFVAVASGPAIIALSDSLPVAISARTGGTGIVWREVGKRDAGLTVTVWTPTPGARDTLGAAVDAVLAGIDYLAAPDTTAIKVDLGGQRISDSSENATLYRRDRDIVVEYSIVQTAQAVQMLLPGGTLAAAGSSVGFGTTLPIADVYELPDGDLVIDTAGNILVQTVGGPTPVVDTESSVVSVTDLVTLVAARVASATVVNEQYPVFNQATPSDLWVIPHGFGPRPSVVIIDSTGRTVEADVQYVSDSQINISFSAATSGSAYLN